MNGTAVIDSVVRDKHQKSADIESNVFYGENKIYQDFLDFDLERKYAYVDGELFLVVNDIPPELNTKQE